MRSKNNRLNNRNNKQRRRNTNNNRATALSFASNANVYNANQLVRFSPDVFGFPDRLLTKVRYHNAFTITSTLGSLGAYAFRWNSTFDPDLTGAGHQPLYRDTLAAIYDQYAVIRATAIITFVNGTANTWIVGAGTDDDSSVAAGIDTITEQSHSQSVMLTPLSGSHSTHKFTINWDCETVLSIDPFASQTYKTAVGTNPTEISTLTMFGVDQVGPASSVINVDVLLMQEVLWTELTTPTQS